MWLLGQAGSPRHLQLPPAHQVEALDELDELDEIAGILAREHAASKTACFCKQVELFSTW